MNLFDPGAADFVNACCEVSALFAKAADIRQALKDRNVQGMSYASALFYTAWSFEFCWYYMCYRSWWCLLTGGIFALLMGYWMWLFFKYRKINVASN